jgi:hypothetical protein
VATLLADPPAAASSKQQPVAGAPGDPQAPTPDPNAPAQRACAKCGAPLDGSQDWCLHCGAGTPDSLSTRSPSWRSAAAVLTLVAILVAGATTAAYAALSKGDDKPRSRTVAVAQIPAPTTTTPVVPTTPPVSETPVAPIGTPTTIKPSVPLDTAKPPKIPLSAPTPQPTGTTSPTTSSPGATGPTTTKNTGGSNSAGESQQAILLDTNAAATYNPYAYPASNFGDPSLAIDGDTSTGWTAVVDPAVAPKMAEGLVIDLNTAQKLSALALSSSTPGMTVQVYGANGHNLPASITDSAWVALSPSLVAKKKHTRIKFGGSTSASKQAAKKPYRYVALWISNAPAASVGTAQAPGHVSVNELELFPLK